jgi:hypothetical protein
MVDYILFAPNLSDQGIMLHEMRVNESDVSSDFEFSVHGVLLFRG